MIGKLGLSFVLLSAGGLAVHSVLPPEAVQAQASPQVIGILQALPRPTGAPKTLPPLFSANAYQQQSLNFQVPIKPAAAVEFYQQALQAKGYQERTVNTVKGDWGFNLVFTPPTKLTLAAKTEGKTVVLVVQGTMLGPDSLNINARFEEV